MKWIVYLMLSFGGLMHAEEAIFAGGCFWCMQQAMDKVPGVTKTVVGYTGGKTANPTYEEVSSGSTGHFEAIEVTYDSNQVTYEALLDAFWKNVDPTDGSGQFCDKGQQYESAIFYLTPEQEKEAMASKQKLMDSGRFPHVYTKILPATVFYAAEEYHQDYYKKNPLRYKFYKTTCGRERRLKQVWGES